MKTLAMRVLSAPAVLVGVLAAQPPIPLDPVRVVDPGVLPTGEIVVQDLNGDGVADLLVGNAFLRFRGLGAFSVTAMDPAGSAVGRVLASGAGLTPITVDVAAGDLVGDFRDDVLVLDSTARVELYENRGHARRRNGFAAPTTFVDLGIAYGPFQALELLVMPVFFVADVDGDGNRDVVMAGHISDRVFGTNRATQLHVYLGDGRGGHARELTVAPAGSALAGRFVDEDGDGRRETLVLLTDLTSGASYGEFVERFAVTSTGGTVALAALGAQAMPFAGRGTNLEVADLDADGLLDYVISVFHPASAGKDPEVWTIQGGAGGKLGSAHRHSLPAPAVSPSEILGLRVVDLDRDGDLDILAAQAHGSAVPARLLYLSGQGRVDTFAVAARDLAASLEVVNGWHVGYTSHPHVTLPDVMEAVDFGLDGRTDIVLAGLRDPSVLGGALFVGVFDSAAPAAPGDGGIRFVGAGSVARGGFDGKIGLRGGRPVVGNGSARVTLTEVPGQSLCGLVVGPVEFQVQLLGRTLYTVPSLVLPAVISQGGGPGTAFAEMPFAIPDNPWLAGRQAYFQWIFLDPNAVGFPVFTSDAMEVRLGT